MTTKMQQARTRAVFQLKYGSSLYGTTTPTSDVDWKVVFLPQFDGLMRNDRISNMKQRPVGLHSTDKMLPGEDETEYVPLQVFLNDFFAGQTYAVEVAFAMLGDMGEVYSPYESRVKSMLTDLVSKFLHNDLKGMIGYAVGQATKYGMKTQRYLQAKALLDMVNAEFDSAGELREYRLTTERLRDRPELLAALLSTGNCTYAAPSVENGNQEFLVLPNKKSFPYGVKWNYFVDNLTGILKEYGNRVKTSLDGEDWKALMHALRISQQVAELHMFGSMKFPRSNREELLSVRRGEVDKEEVLTRFSNVMALLETPGVLQDLTTELEEEFLTWKDGVLREFYVEEAKEFFGL